MSANKKIPKGTIAIGIFLILLLPIEALVVVFLTPGMPLYYYSIGVFFMILGVIILLYAYKKYKSGAYIMKPSQEAIAPGEEQLVTDEDLRKAFKKSIALFFIGWILAAASAAALPAMFRTGQMNPGGFFFAMGIAFGLIGTYFLIIYKTNPDRYREILTKRMKRKMKKKS